jgi:K+-transporting ATPase KdpF subunit
LENAHGLVGLAARAVPAGAGRVGADVRVHGRLRESLRDRPMIWLTVLVTLFLFIYLFAALLRPEWF